MGLKHAFLLSSAFTAGSLAQLFPFPKESGEIICDGAIRPDYKVCKDDVLPQTFDDPTVVGPGINEGSTFKSDKCRIRVVRCGGSTDSTFDVDDVSAMFGLIRNECGDFPAGGAYRSGDACVLVDTESNPLRKRYPEPEPQPEPVPAPVMSAERKAKEVRRNLVAESRDLNARCDPPPGPCYTYNEGTFITNVRGSAQRVCDNILPKGARCDQSRSVTTEESFTISTDIGAGIKDIVDVGASFSSETSKSTTEEITTAITVDCPDGGYIVWYPLMEVSRGECGKGPQETCNGGCITDEVTQCEFRKPIESGKGKLSGEYDVQCV